MSRFGQIVPVMYQFLFSHLFEWRSVLPFMITILPEDRCTIFHSDIIRYFDVSSEEPGGLNFASNTIPLSRESVCFLGTGVPTYLHEFRASVALAGYAGRPLHPFTIITIKDFNEGCEHEMESEHFFNLDVGGDEWAGISFFLKVLQSTIDQACAAWRRVLDKLQTDISVTVSPAPIHSSVKRHIRDTKLGDLRCDA